jgi:thioredoxin reductase (NADPH)
MQESGLQAYDLTLAPNVQYQIRRFCFKMLYDVIVVGGSAAGLTAALYSARQGLRTLVLTKDIGGQMLLTNEIQNYPGVSNITGFDLATKLREQAELYGAEFAYEEVTSVQEDSECPGLCFKVVTTEKEHNATAVILAFGKTPKDLGVPGEQGLKGRGVSYCAVCDGPLFKGKTVAVVGAGDQALEAANYLSGVAGMVYLVHNYPRPIGSEEMIEQVLALKNVESVPNSKVAQISGGQTLKSITVLGTESRLKHDIAVDGLFIEIGYTAKTEFLSSFVELNDKKEVEVDKEAKTSRPGVFAAGDVTDSPYKQAVISAAQGSIAALSAYNYIQRLRGRTAARADWRALKPVPRAV